MKVEQNFVGKWYKEKGGDGKWIKLIIQLIDSRGQLVVNYHQIRIKLTLFYELNKKTPVDNQSILRIDDPDNLVIGNNGTTKINVRIEDISSKHCHQNFIIKIEADPVKSPNSSSIIPVFTNPIEVLSRPPKQKRGREEKSDQNIQPTILIGKEVDEERIEKKQKKINQNDFHCSNVTDGRSSINSFDRQQYFDSFRECSLKIVENDQLF